MKQTNLVSFSVDNLPTILIGFGRKINNAGYVVDKDNHMEECYICKTILKQHKVGNIMPGSEAFICDNPACFAEYIAKEML